MRLRTAMAVSLLIFGGALAVLFARGLMESPQPSTAAPASAPAPATPAPAAAPPAPEEKHAPTVTATLKVVSLADAKPLAGMVPIITVEPNAFDEPLAHGDPTGADGVSVFTFANDRKVCLRAWDPNLDYFPNNFFEVTPDTESSATEGTVAMAKSASLHALLLRPDNTPVANETVRMMMYHPKRGAWWPAEAKTDAGGAVAFERVPPGMFAIQMECASGRMRAEDVTLLPGETGDLGPILLAAL